ncbi:hypothetical protein [Hymenobacter wooponensis]|uniref:Uncharacterized protein n=1 Tax=Hymenobacter wooponensis TaxID=1525360 RepID=A0A4Z0MVC4_9BACT|nr:hypothetical protein [Hymenobacter wooponensis]TGD83177.1 hypothetical protein EU557_05195 [Hymenobacter wooponensis]
MRYCFLLTGLALLVAHIGYAQVAPIVALPDVKVSNQSSHLVVASGRGDRKNWHLTAPGGATAVRFLAPREKYHELRQIRLHLRHTNQLREGQLQIRIASVATTGIPANDNLLPVSLLLSTADLRRARNHLTLEWPTAHLVVPTGGFFIVIECLGQSADEYASRLLPPETDGKLRIEISHRTQPNTSTRIADASGFPVLQATQPDSSAAESWYRDTATQQWRRNRVGQSGILLDAVFE